MQMEGNDLEQPWLALYEADPILLVYLHSPTLQSLDISQCGLTELPASMAVMRSLKTLNVSHNALETLPRALGDLPALEALCVEGNPLAPHLSALLEQARLNCDSSFMSSQHACLYIPYLSCESVCMRHIPALFKLQTQLKEPLPSSRGVGSESSAHAGGSTFHLLYGPNATQLRECAGEG